MLKNYFLTAWRNLLKTKGYSALNISGLAIGMAVALLIGLWVYDQYNYDKFLPDYQRLYQVRRNYNNNGTILSGSTGYNTNTSILPNAVAIDSSGNVWSASAAGNIVTQLIGAATPVVTPLSVAARNGSLGTRP